VLQQPAQAALGRDFFAVRPRLAFGLWEKNFVEKTTRWKFE
jgi:hypothetical protein